MDTIYTLTSSGTTNTTLSARTFKGTTDVVFQLSSIQLGNLIPIKLVAFFGTGNVYTRDYDFTSNESILLSALTHTYRFEKEEAQTIKTYNNYIRITYSNFVTYNYNMTISIYAESFYSEHKTLTIANTQFIDDVDNTMYVVYENSNGDVFNSVLLNT